ncbi:putative NADH:ubiquinone reductase (H(+)-translocating) [Helianthus annuus]|nr:putative NADH:ubiquinone reductase (H(+)-translocating) [Helianthus annuus]
MTEKIEIVMNSIEFPLFHRTTQNSVISTTLNDLSNWSRLSSLWPLLYGTSCCFLEFASLIGSRFDFDRYGLVPRSSPRQADLILTAGTVTMKMAPSLVRLYEQMPEPNYETRTSVTRHKDSFFLFLFNGTQLSLFTHYMWIGGFLIVGAAAHAGIFNL